MKLNFCLKKKKMKIFSAHIPIDEKPIEWKIIKNILSQVIPERQVWAFGSRANENKKEFSNLNIVVLGEEYLAPEKEADLPDAFINSDLPTKIGIVLRSLTTDQFKSIIKQSNKVIQKI
jgi:type I restriction enzyme S subunit